MKNVSEALSAVSLRTERCPPRAQRAHPPSESGARTAYRPRRSGFHVFRRRAVERSGASVLDDCAAAHTGPRPENPPPGDQPERKAGLPFGPAPRGHHAERLRRPRRGFEARPTRPRPTRPRLAAVTRPSPSPRGGSRRGACRRSGPGARPSVRGSRGAAGFPGGGMWPLKRHRPRRLLRCAHEPAAGKHGDPLREDDTAVLAPLSFGRMSGLRPRRQRSARRLTALGAFNLDFLITVLPPKPGLTSTR